MSIHYKCVNYNFMVRNQPYNYAYTFSSTLTVTSTRIQTYCVNFTHLQRSCSGRNEKIASEISNGSFDIISNGCVFLWKALLNLDLYRKSTLSLSGEMLSMKVARPLEELGVLHFLLGAGRTWWFPSSLNPT